MDDLDLLDATIDPSDFKSLHRVKKLQQELEYEQAKIACKEVTRFARLPGDPMRIKE